MTQSLRKIPLFILVALAALGQAGCQNEDWTSRGQWFQWKWGRKKTPLTRPEYVAPIGSTGSPYVTGSGGSGSGQTGAPDTRTIAAHPTQLPDVSASPSFEFGRGEGLDEPPSPTEVRDALDDALPEGGEPEEQGRREIDLEDLFDEPADEETPAMVEFGPIRQDESGPIDLTELGSD